MTIPAWLANLEWELDLAKDDRGSVVTFVTGETVVLRPYAFQLYLLDAYCGAVNRWLETTRVQGNRDARRVWARTCRVFLSVAYFVALRGCEGHGWPRIVDTCVRLNGLRLTPDPWR